MPKRYGHVIMGVVMGLLLLPTASFAHVYATDGPIRVLLHTDPDDNPPTHEQSQLNFYAFDDENKFLGTQCTCAVVVTGNGATILNQKIFTDQNAAKNIAAVPIVFPKLGVYTITLTGQPITGASFHPFTLHYTVRVAQEGKVVASSASRTSLLVNAGKLVAIYALAAVVIVAIIVMSTRRDRGRRWRSASPGEGQDRQHERDDTQQ